MSYWPGEDQPKERSKRAGQNARCMKGTNIWKSLLHIQIQKENGWCLSTKTCKASPTAMSVNLSSIYRLSSYKNVCVCIYYNDGTGASLPLPMTISPGIYYLPKAPIQGNSTLQDLGRWREFTISRLEFEPWFHIAFTDLIDHQERSVMLE